jgi:hypothetical protein
MTAETDALTSELRAIQHELKPYGDFARKEYADDLLALGVLLRREIRALGASTEEKIKGVCVSGIELPNPYRVTICPPRHADGVKPIITAKSSRKGKKSE